MPALDRLLMVGARRSQAFTEVKSEAKSAPVLEL
jgi:hypothetical protein